MKNRFFLLLSVLLLAVSGCAPAVPALADAPDQEQKTGAPPVPESCPVTQANQGDFVPPKPWPEEFPYAGQAWFGTADLWTALPESGNWPQLALGEKSWWWSEEFDVNKDSTPDLVVTARRLDGKGVEFRSEEATNGFHEDFNWAMLTGVDLPTTGCWEITGRYGEHALQFIVWVP